MMIMVIILKLKKTVKSWLADYVVFVDANLPENFRCIVSGPSECGKAYL